MMLSPDRSDVKRAVALLIAIGVIFPSPAYAISCTVGVTGLSFGNYDAVTKTGVTGNTFYVIDCSGSGTVSYVLTLSPGQFGNALARYLYSGSMRLRYQVYRDAARTQILGDGTGGTYTISGSGTLSSNSYSTFGSLYGTIPAGQAAVPGSYADTLTVQISY